MHSLAIGAYVNALLTVTWMSKSGSMQVHAYAIRALTFV